MRSTSPHATTAVSPDMPTMSASRYVAVTTPSEIISRRTGFIHRPHRAGREEAGHAAERATADAREGQGDSNLAVEEKPVLALREAEHDLEHHDPRRRR